MIRTILFLLTILIIGNLSAIPPKPPLGKRWVLNDQFSDEFNGTKIDDSKWFDYHPTWKGRVPGLFLPSQVSVRNGYMSIRGEKMKKDTTIRNWNGTTSTYNIACGAVISKTQDASYGYYECCFKAAKTTMSTTFWMSTRRNYNGPKACNDRYGLELDFQECIGREGDFNGTYFAKGMHSNSHFWYTDCEGEKHDLRASQVQRETEILPSDTFHIYGGWWRNASSASYYLNNEEIGSHQFNTSIKSKPFDQTMGLNMVSETYPFPWISLPTDEELADPAKNTCYYDWVRAYNLVDVDSEVEGQETVMFSESISFETKPQALTNSLNFVFPLSYMANADRSIHLQLKDASNAVVHEQTYPGLGGFGNKVLNFALNTKLENLNTYTMQAHIRPFGASNNDDAYESDSFSFIVRDPAKVTVIVQDQLRGNLLTGATVDLSDSMLLSDGAGQVVFEDIPVGIQFLKISHPGYNSIIISEFSLNTDTTVNLRLHPKDFRLNVFLKDSITNNPVKGAYLIAGNNKIRTDGSGKANAVLPYGENSVLVNIPGYYEIADTIFNDGKTDAVVFITKSNATVTFLTQLDGKYFADASIMLGDLVKLSSSLGKAIFEEVEVQKMMSYSITKDTKEWWTDSVYFYNDTTIHLKLRTTGFEKIGKDGFTIYPNPAKIHLDVIGAKWDDNYYIYNANGVLIQTGTLSKNRIDIKYIPSGTYVIRIEDVIQTFIKN